jgi:hypothetical protein
MEIRPPLTTKMRWKYTAGKLVPGRQRADQAAMHDIRLARECNGSDFNSTPNDRASLCMAATVVSMRVSAHHAGFLLA